MTRKCDSLPRALRVIGFYVASWRTDAIRSYNGVSIDMWISYRATTWGRPPGPLPGPTPRPTPRPHPPAPSPASPPGPLPKPLRALGRGSQIYQMYATYWTSGRTAVRAKYTDTSVLIVFIVSYRFIAFYMMFRVGHVRASVQYRIHIYRFTQTFCTSKPHHTFQADALRPSGPLPRLHHHRASPPTSTARPVGCGAQPT